MAKVSENMVTKARRHARAHVNVRLKAAGSRKRPVGHNEPYDDVRKGGRGDGKLA